MLVNTKHLYKKIVATKDSQMAQLEDEVAFCRVC